MTTVPVPDGSKEVVRELGTGSRDAGMSITDDLRGFERLAKSK
jgi:hypothetical protein